MERDDSPSGFFVRSRREAEGLAGLNRRHYLAIRLKDDEMFLRWMQISGFAGVLDIRQEISRLRKGVRQVLCNTAWDCLGFSDAVIFQIYPRAGLSRLNYESRLTGDRIRNMRGILTLHSRTRRSH